MSESKLKDEAVAAAMEAAESKRQAERLRGLLDEARTKLVDVTAERDELRRELAQVLASERAVRRRVILAGVEGVRMLHVDQLREDLDVGGPPS